MIPAEAVEVSAKEIYSASGRSRQMPYSVARNACEAEARKVLEAAAPYKLAEAWDAGYEQADSDAPHAIKSENPYRQR
jgi:hypothetical protein